MPEGPEDKKGLQDHLFELGELLRSGSQCADLASAKKWKSKAEVLLRRISSENPTLAKQIAPILSDLQNLKLEMTVMRLSGPDEILDQILRDQAIDLLKLASESMSLSVPRPGDSERLRRRKEIARAYAEHRGEPKYIAPVCRDLQKAKIKMPQRWLDEWKAKGLRLEPCDWFLAYQSPLAKARIQRYISKICKRKVSQGQA